MLLANERDHPLESGGGFDIETEIRAARKTSPDKDAATKSSFT
jgi:hypothetical protein